jgi:16S rRNA (cytosine967-C5)-methyltransferase
VPGCYRLADGDPGDFRRQDIGSQVIVGLLELEPDELFLDLCAAPGNKTAQALETPIRGIACDRSYRRLRECAGIGASLVVCDGARPLPFVPRFDKILVDAPCSGTGTIGRNPEIKWRVSPEDLNRHRDRQAALLDSAMAVLTASGRLVYSTCSLEPEENEDVVRQLLEAHPSVAVERSIRRLPGREAGDGFFAAVITSKKPLND